MSPPADVPESARTSVLRPTVIAWTVLASILVSFLVVVTAAEDARSLAGRVGGDFPAFYGAGSIVLDGDADQLYDLDRQADAQDEIIVEDSLLYFAYPPPVAGAYSLLAAVPYVGAYVIHTVLMLAALLVGLALIRPLVPVPRIERPVVVALAITFVPLFMGVTLGQNSALVFLLVAASWRFAHDGRPGLTGLVLGLLLFKPQYAVPLIGLHLLRGRWRIPVVSALVAAAWWSAGALMLGTSWLTDWFDQVGEFTAVDAEINGANAVSWLGIAEHAFGVGSVTALAVGGGLLLATAAVLAVVWWRAEDHRLAVPMAAAGAGILLTSPHAMFYDAGLLVITATGVWATGRVRGLGRLIAIGWVLGALHPLKALVGFTPVSIAVIGGFAAAVLAWWESQVRGVPPPTDVERLGPGRADPTPPELSVIIPAYDEAGRVEPTLERLRSWLGERDIDAEVIVVDDGSHDDTSARCVAYADQLPGFRVLRLVENRGKGYAVRMGMLAATGRWRAFLDADGSTDPSELDKLMDTGAAVAIASVAVEGAVLDRPQSKLRASLGRFGNVVIQRLVLPGIVDSQRGCKLFRGDVADAVFAECRVDRWGFDVEALARARALGHEPAEIGVEWEHRPVGHVRPWHYLTTIGDVLRVRQSVGFQPVVTAEPSGNPVPRR